MSSQTLPKPAERAETGVSSTFPPFKIESVERPRGHWRMCIKTALGHLTALTNIGDYRDYVSGVHDGVVCRGEVTEKYNPLRIADVVAHYGIGRLVISPELTARIFTQKDWVSPTMANVFFWQNHADEVFVVVLGKCSGDRWVLRRYPIDKAPDFMTGCRIFIPAPVAA